MKSIDVRSEKDKKRQERYRAAIEKSLKEETAICVCKNENQPLAGRIYGRWSMRSVIHDGRKVE